MGPSHLGKYTLTRDWVSKISLLKDDREVIVTPMLSISEKKIGNAEIVPASELTFY